MAALPPAPPRCSLLTLPVLRAAGREVCGRDLLDAAWARGELSEEWTRFRTGQTALEFARAHGLTASADRVDEVINEVRYRHDLVAAEDVEPWLHAHGLTLTDLHQHGERAFWRQQGTNPSAAPVAAPANAAAAGWEAFAADLFLGGQFVPLARRQAARLMTRASQSSAATHVIDQEIPPATLAWLGRDAAWGSEHLRTEASHTAACAALVTAEARTSLLRRHSRGLTRVELAWLDFDSHEAMREARQCMESDGLSLDAVAHAALLQVETHTALVEDLSAELRQVVATRTAGQVIPLADATARHFRLLQIRCQHPPELTDPVVHAKVEAGIIAAHFEPRLVAEVQWLLPAAQFTHGA